MTVLAAADQTLEERNKEADRRFVEEAINRRRLDLLPDLVVEDFVEENPPPGQGPGRKGLGDFLAVWFTAFPDLDWQLQDLTAEGDVVAAWSIWTGTHSAPFMGIPATGRKVAVEAWTRDRFVDGRLASSRLIMDSAGMLRQLGVLPG